MSTSGADPVCCVGVWHDAQPNSSNRADPVLHLVVVDVAHGRDGERAGVEGHAAQAAVGDLGIAPVGRGRRTRSVSRCTSPAGSSDDVMPMSPLNAPAACASTVGTLAFHPKRPSSSCSVRGFHAVFGRPEMPSPSSSSGSAAPTMSASGIASSRPTPMICGASRGEIRMSSPSGPNARSSIV